MAKQDWGSFIKSDQQDRYRLVGASYGEQGTAKTHLWLGGPGPVGIQSMDFGLEGVVNKWQKKKDIFVKEYDWSPGQEGLSQDDAIELRDQFIEDYELLLKKARTIIWDKESEVWELFRYAEFGAPNDAPKNYPELNQRYKHLVRRAVADREDVNFGLIQGVKEKWVSKPKRGEPSVLQAHNTGEFERTGFKELGNLVHLDMWHRREGGKYVIDVGKCRQNTAISDQSFSFDPTNADDFNPFVFMALQVFPESEPSDWGA